MAHTLLSCMATVASTYPLPPTTGKRVNTLGTWHLGSLPLRHISGHSRHHLNPGEDSKAHTQASQAVRLVIAEHPSTDVPGNISIYLGCKVMSHPEIISQNMQNTWFWFIKWAYSLQDKTCHCVCRPLPLSGIKYRLKFQVRMMLEWRAASVCQPVRNKRHIVSPLPWS